MFCRKDSDDPIAREIYRSEGLLLLQRGFNPKELEPGRILRLPSSYSDRPVVRSNGAKLFEGWKKPKFASWPYRRLSREKQSNSFDASAAADLTGILTGDPAGISAVKGALTAAQVDSLKVSLDGSVLRYMDVDEFEQAIASSPLTDLALRYRDEGQRAFVVTDTLIVTGATLHLKDAASASALLDLGAAALAKAGLKAEADTTSKASIFLDPGSEEVAIAIRVLEIDWSTPDRLRLAPSPTALVVRNREKSKPEERRRLADHYLVANLDDLRNGESLFVTLDGSEDLDG